MLIEQFIEVESRVPGLLVVHIPKTGYFHDKTEIFKGKSLIEWFNAKNVAASNVPWFPWSGQVTKFNPKMQDFKRVLDLTTWREVKGGICSTGFQISKICSFKWLWKRSKCNFFPKTYKK